MRASMRRFVLMAILSFGLMGCYGNAEDLNLGGGVTMTVVSISPGTFTMGQGGQVTLTHGYKIGATEVSQSQYAAVMGGNGGTSPQSCDWYSASNFCQQLSINLGRTVRLPTDAEWEYACRAGTTGTWFFGEDVNQLGNYAWWSGNSGGSTHAVGTKLPNAWGLYDTYGNLWEWVSDWYGTLPTTPVTDPQGPSSGSTKVLRGGAFDPNCPSSDDTSIYRLYDIPPTYNLPYFGFRVVVELPADSPPAIDNGSGASSILSTSATLNGNLSSTGTAATTVSVYYGTVDKGMTTTGWDHALSLGQHAVGAVSANVTGLGQSTTYYYRFYAVNSVGAAWGDPAAQFTTISAPTINNGSGASGITPSFAQLNGNLTAGGSATVTAYWGTTDGGTTASSWQHSTNIGVQVQGAISCGVSGLNSSTAYYYRYYAANAAGTAWAGSTASFQTSATPFDGWACKMKVQFSGYNHGETLTNFPALLILGANIANFAYGQFASTNGYDLRFLDSTGITNLNYEVESWNTSGRSFVWVQLPLIRASTDYIWVYWGNAAAASAPSVYATNSAVWSTSEYLAVYHMAGTNSSGKCWDSTANHYDALDSGSPGTSNDVGVVGNCRGFNGTSAYLDTQQKIFGTALSRFTISGWVYLRQARERDGLFGQNDSIEFGMDTGNNPAHGIGGWCNGGGYIPCGNGIVISNWWYVAFEGDGVNNILYTNAVVDASTGGGGPYGGITDDNARLGAAVWDASGEYMDGRLDEVRFEKVARSTNWLWASYMEMLANSSFASYQIQSGGSGTNTATVNGIPHSWLLNYGIANMSDSVETENPDGDGLNNLQEYIAGTDPTNRNSCLSLTITNVAGQIVVRLPSVQASGTNYTKARYYEIDQRTNLVSGATWQAISGYTSVLGNGSVIACTNATQNKIEFYRAKVWLQ